MNPLVQYLKDTRAELRHVAWPTRAQTIVYTVIVAALSVGVALYLGFFDYLFTTGLARSLSALPTYQSQQIEAQTATPSTGTTTTTATVPAGVLNLVPGTANTPAAPTTNTETQTKTQTQTTPKK